MKFRYFALVVSLLMVFSESIAAQGVMNLITPPITLAQQTGSMTTVRTRSVMRSPPHQVSLITLITAVIALGISPRTNAH